MHVLAVIPARYQSTRFPGKPLVDIKGKPMIQRVFEQVTQCQLVNEVKVATDSKEIFSYCNNAEIPVVMTSDTHQSGTDRVAEVAKASSADIILNVQGDEPLMPPMHVDSLLRALVESDYSIATLVAPIKSQSLAVSKSCVKVVKRSDDRALYFSRLPIPFGRDLAENTIPYLQHVGIYGFRREALLELARLPVGELERLEKLEQLRWLEAGFDILTVQVPSAAMGIDTKEDLLALLEFMERQQID